MVVGAGLGCLAVGHLVDPVVRRYGVAVGDQILPGLQPQLRPPRFDAHVRNVDRADPRRHRRQSGRWLVATVIQCQAERVASEDGVYARMFQRHAHPFSAWSRLLSTPLLLVPLWTRRWWLYGPIGAWLAVNPVITPPIHDTSSFATRAILGEESWSRKPTSDPVVLALTGVATASLVGAMVAAYQRREAGAVIGTGVFMALTLWEWKLWADRFARERSRTGA